MAYKNTVNNSDNSIWFISSNYLTTNWINEAVKCDKHLSGINFIWIDMSDEIDFIIIIVVVVGCCFCLWTV